jgi:hypothetical protein
MRSNQNPSGPVTRGVGGQTAAEPSMTGKNLSMPRMPVEWLDAGSWRLPSGKALAEFALQAGFLAPLLFKADGFSKSELKSEAGLAGMARGKQLGKGDSR